VVVQHLVTQLIGDHFVGHESGATDLSGHGAVINQCAYSIAAINQCCTCPVMEQ
jgi:hypothetical protein